MREDPTDIRYDAIVLGSGAAGLAAAVTASALKLRVLVVERDTLIGGTTAISGGAIWIPGTRQATSGGFSDSPEAARTYLRALLGNRYNEYLVEAFLRHGPEALKFLEDHTELNYSVRQLSPDYYPDLPGATDRGRALEVAAFDGRKLGHYFRLLRSPPKGMMLFGGMMLSRTDVQHFLNMRKSLVSLWHCTKLLFRFGRDRLGYSRGTRLVIGNAMAAALVHGALKNGVQFMLNAQTTTLLSSGGRVLGVRIRSSDGQERDFFAKGVILATGGMANAFFAPEQRTGTGTDHLSMAAPFADGTMINMARGMGAAIANGLASNFYWAPMSRNYHVDGSFEVFPHIVTDRAKPGIIALTGDGRRFVNEANSYHRFVKAMLEERQKGVTRFFLVADRVAIRTYGLGLARPWPGDNRKLVESGYLIVASTLDALGSRLGMGSVSLKSAVDAFNRHAISGSDPIFHRGESSYNLAMGDPTARFPNLGPIATPPFFAVEIHTGDLGSAKGLVTDAGARVLGQSGTPIGGLYAAGNDMNSIMAGEYPGPGITLGPALTFGYVAAKSLASDMRGALA